MIERSEFEPALQDFLNLAARHIPDGYRILIGVENGAAWVNLQNDDEDYLALPDSADKSIVEQVNDALAVANGFI